MRKSLSVLNVALAIVITPTLAICEGTPCHDSDGDSWADPEAAIDSCSPDNCPAMYNYEQADCSNVGDPVVDGVINVQDVVKTVGVAFRGEMPAFDSACADVLKGGTDNNCDGKTDLIDVVTVVNVAFRGQQENFCKPCSCDCYPSSCPEIPGLVNLLPNNGNFERHCQGTLDGWLSNGGTLVDIASPGAGRWGIRSNCLPSCHPPWSMAAILSGDQPAGVYFFSIAYRPEWPSDQGAIAFQFGGQGGDKWDAFDADTVWNTISFVDTLTSEEPPPSYFYFFILGNGLFDNAVVRYLGPAVK